MMVKLVYGYRWLVSSKRGVTNDPAVGPVVRELLVYWYHWPVSSKRGVTNDPADGPVVRKLL